MSDNGKGSNTAKRTNFKKFNEGWDKIDWSKKETPPEPSKSVEELVKEVKDKLEKLRGISDADKPTGGNSEEGK